MVGQQTGVLIASLGGSLLEIGRSHAVESLPILAHERSVSRLLDQRMLEAVLRFGPPSRLTDQVESLQFGEGWSDLTAITADERLQRRQLKVATEN